MIKSRLRDRRVTKTITVKVKTFASGQHTEATLYSGLIATYEQRQSVEVSGEAGGMVVVTDVFFFEPVTTGTLPAIEEKHVLIDSGSVRYEVVSVVDQGGGGNRLEVITRRLR